MSSLGAVAVNLTGKGPLGLKQPKPERGTAKARAHIARVKQLPCVICRKPGPSDAHHVICDRYGTRKASDFEVIPLCKAHHQDGPEAIHNGKASWVEKHGPDHEFLEAVRRMLDAL
jgi:hypothetical protein